MERRSLKNASRKKYIGRGEHCVYMQMITDNVPYDISLVINSFPPHKSPLYRFICLHTGQLPSLKDERAVYPPPGLPLVRWPVPRDWGAWFCLPGPWSEVRVSNVVVVLSDFSYTPKTSEFISCLAFFRFCVLN